MCEKAAQTAGELMTNLEPEFVQLLTIEGIVDTPDGVAAVNAFNSASKLLAAWTPGTSPSATLIEAIEDVQTVFNGLPLPDVDKSLAGVVSATLVIILGLVKGKATPAPSAIAASNGDGSAAQTIHENAIEASVTTQVQTLVPGFKRSIFHTIGGQQKRAWNKAVAETAKIDPKYAALKVS